MSDNVGFRLVIAAVGGPPTSHCESSAAASAAAFAPICQPSTVASLVMRRLSPPPLPSLSAPCAASSAPAACQLTLLSAVQAVSSFSPALFLPGRLPPPSTQLWHLLALPKSTGTAEPEQDLPFDRLRTSRSCGSGDWILWQRSGFGVPASARQGGVQDGPEADRLQRRASMAARTRSSFTCIWSRQRCGMCTRMTLVSHFNYFSTMRYAADSVAKWDFLGQILAQKFRTARQHAQILFTALFQVFCSHFESDTWMKLLRDFNISAQPISVTAEPVDSWVKLIWEHFHFTLNVNKSRNFDRFEAVFKDTSAYGFWALNVQHTYVWLACISSIRWRAPSVSLRCDMRIRSSPFCARRPASPVLRSENLQCPPPSSTWLFAFAAPPVLPDTSSVFAPAP